MFRKHVLTPSQDLQSNEHYNSVTMTTTPRCHCNVSLLCSLTPAAFRTLTADQTELNNQFWIFKIFLFIPLLQKTPSFHYKCFLSPILFNIWKIQSWTKMLRKIHLVCFILEYFTPKTRTLKILSPPPKKTMLKGHRNISGPDLTTLIRRGGGRGHHDAKFTGCVPRV